MRNLKRQKIKHIFTLIFISVFCVNANATISLLHDVRATLPLRAGSQLEGDRLAVSLQNTAREMDARNEKHGYYSESLAVKYKLSFDGISYYVDAATLLPKTKPNETCKPLPIKELEPYADGYPSVSYLCNEGKVKSASGVLLFFNTNFANVGTYELKIKDPDSFFVTDIDAIGINNKDRNELLVTARYSYVSSGFSSARNGLEFEEKSSMTILLRLKAVDGKIQVEQDDTCLKNPNKINKIATARKLLKQCEANSQKPPLTHSKNKV